MGKAGTLLTAALVLVAVALVCAALWQVEGEAPLAGEPPPAVPEAAPSVSQPDPVVVGEGSPTASATPSGAGSGSREPGPTEWLRARVQARFPGVPERYHLVMARYLLTFEPHTTHATWKERPAIDARARREWEAASAFLGPRLVPVLDSVEAAARNDAVLLLGGSGAPEAAPGIVSRYDREPCDRVRETMDFALAQQGYFTEYHASRLSLAADREVSGRSWSPPRAGLPPPCHGTGFFPGTYLHAGRMLFAIHHQEAVRVQQQFLDTHHFDGSYAEELAHGVDLCALVSGLRTPWR